MFANPIGKNGRDTFVADGGELMFRLPNGLQGYIGGVGTNTLNGGAGHVARIRYDLLDLVLVDAFDILSLV